MKSYWVYATEEHAIEALEHYESFLMRSTDVSYVAVIKKQDCDPVCYGLEIGISANNDNIYIDSDITPEEAFNGLFPENAIPEYLPVPSLYKKANEYMFQNVLRMEELGNFFNQTRNTVLVERKKTDEIRIALNKATAEVKTKEKNWYKFRYGRQPIKISNGSLGTLGGFFELEEFPDSLFGISNWHVLSPSRDLGDLVFSHNSKEIGEVFWQQLDINLECAFLRFNPKTSKKLKKAYNDGHREWKLGKPVIGKNVFHEGFGTFGGGNGERTDTNYADKIYSNNATVRVYCDAFENNLKIFKNQILIKNFSEDGDSGAIVVMKDGKNLSIVGLLFARFNASKIDKPSSYSSLSIANNLNFIFNKTFNQKKEVFKQITKQNLVKTQLVDQFTLVKNKFY